MSEVQWYISQLEMIADSIMTYADYSYLTLHVGTYAARRSIIARIDASDT